MLWAGLVKGLNVRQHFWKLGLTATLISHVTTARLQNLNFLYAVILQVKLAGGYDTNVNNHERLYMNMRHSHQKVVPCQCWPAQFQLPGSSYRGSKFRWPIASGSGFRSNTECGIKIFLVCLKEVSMYAFRCSLWGSWTFKVAGLQLFHNVPCRLLRLLFVGFLAPSTGHRKTRVGRRWTGFCVCTTTELKSSKTGRKTCSPSSTTGGHSATWASFSTNSGPGRDWAVKASFTGGNLVPPVFVLHSRTWKSASATTHFCYGHPFFCCLFYTLWTLCVLRKLIFYVCATQ